MERYPSLQEVLNNEDVMIQEPSRSLMLSDNNANSKNKFGCKDCYSTFPTVLDAKMHVFAHHPGEELAIRDFR